MTYIQIQILGVSRCRLNNKFNLFSDEFNAQLLTLYHFYIQLKCIKTIKHSCDYQIKCQEETNKLYISISFWL